MEQQTIMNLLREVRASSIFQQHRSVAERDLTQITSLFLRRRHHLPGPA